MTGSVVPERLNWMIVHELVHILGERELNVYYCLMNVTVNLFILVSVYGTLTRFNFVQLGGYLFINTADACAEWSQKENLFDRLPWLSPSGSFAVAVLSVYCCIKLYQKTRLYAIDQGYSTSLSSGPKRKTTGGSWATQSKTTWMNRCK